jgi:hypothetical protein
MLYPVESRILIVSVESTAREDFASNDNQKSRAVAKRAAIQADAFQVLNPANGFDVE